MPKPRSYPFERFGGLDLRDAPDESSCVDVLNVEVEPGRIRSRAGYGTAIATSTARMDSLYSVRTTGTDYILVGTVTPTLEVFSTSGVAQTVTRVGGGTGTTQTASASMHNFVSFGTPTTEYVYAANGANQIRRFEPSTLTWTEPAGLSSYTTRLLAVTPWDNRLVTEGTTQKSRVWFSDPGAPETIGADNYIDLDPGDGEQIRAIKAWRDLLFVFKETKFYVFYGTSTDGSGGAQFNYRTIGTGIGVSGANSLGVGMEQRLVCVGPDALFFLSANGLYKTTGGPPVEVSGGIKPLFYDTALAPYFTSTVTPTGARYLVYSQGRLWLGAGNYAWIYDVEVGNWSLFSVPANTYAADVYLDTFDAEALRIGAHDLVLKYYRGSTSTSDNGTAITSRYRQGFWTPDSQQAQSTVRELILEGTGTVTVKGSTDWGALGSGTNVALGTSPAIAENRYRVAQRGRHHSYEFSATSPWSLQRVQALVRDRRPVTAK